MSRVEIPPGQLPVPGARGRLRCEGRDIALFNLDGTLYAIDDSCPHQGASLSSGTLNGRLIQCRAHNLRFDLATGLMPGTSDFGVRRYDIECEGERVFLLVPDAPHKGDPA